MAIKPPDPLQDRRHNSTNETIAWEGKRGTADPQREEWGSNLRGRQARTESRL